MGSLSTRPHRPARHLGKLSVGLSPGAVALAVGALVWELLGRAADYRFLPPLSAVLERLAELIGSGDLVTDLAASLLNLAIGFGISVVVGITVGLLMGVSQRIRLALSVYVYALVTTPSIVFAPIFFSIFGLGREPIIAVIITFAIFKIIINTETGIRSVPSGMIEMARSYNATRMQIFTKILLPAAAPLIMVALQVGVASSVQGMVNAEMFIAVIGIGATVMAAGRRFDSETVLAVLIVLIAVAFLLSKAVQLMDSRFTGWLPATTRKGSE